MKQLYVVTGTVKGYYHLMQYVEDITGHPQQASIEKRLGIIQFFEKYGKKLQKSPTKRNVQRSFFGNKNSKKRAVNCQHWLPVIDHLKTKGTG